MFDTAKLEASQRALSHAVDMLRVRAAVASSSAAAAANDGGFEVSRPLWLAVSPEGLCVALRACVDTGRGTVGGAGGTMSGLGSFGAYGTAPAIAGGRYDKGSLGVTKLV